MLCIIWSIKPAKQTEESTTLLKSIREVRSQGELLPLTIRQTDRQISSISCKNINLTEQKPTTRNFNMNQCPWEGKLELQLMNCCSMRVDKSDKNSRGIQSFGEPLHFWVLPFGVLSSLLCFWQGEGQRSYVVIWQGILFFSARPTLRRNSFTSS